MTLIKVRRRPVASQAGERRGVLRDAERLAQADMAFTIPKDCLPGGVAEGGTITDESGAEWRCIGVAELDATAETWTVYVKR